MKCQTWRQNVPQCSLNKHEFLSGNNNKFLNFCKTVSETTGIWKST